MKEKTSKPVILIFVLTVVGKIMGFIRSMIIAAYYGADNVTDAYYLTNGIISNVFYAITMSVSVAFLPLYIKVKEEKGKLAGKQFASRVLVNMSMLSGMVTLVLIAVAPLVIKIVAFSYVGTQFQMAVRKKYMGMYLLQRFSTALFL